MSSNVKLAPHALIIFGLLAMGVGAIAGYAFSSAASKSPNVPDDATNVTRRISVKVPDSSALSGQADSERLRRRIGELEKLLAERENSLKKLMADNNGRVPPPPPEEGQREEQSARSRWERWREDREARLERMKTEDPEAYEAEMKRREERQKRQEEWRERMKAESEDRNGFLAAIDTESMTPERKKEHEDLIAALALRDSLGERMMPGNDNPLTDEERHQFFDSMRTIGPLMEKERRYILEEVGKAYGEDGESFANYIQDVYDFTSMWGRRGNRPPRGPGGPGEPGGPRGGGNHGEAR